MAKYYSEKRSEKKDGTVTTTTKYGEKDDMLYQFFLFCANSVKNDSKTEFDAVTYGPVRGSAKRFETFNHPQPEPEPEPEPEPTPAGPTE